MSKPGKGLHTYTVQEAQNSTLGQAGTVYLSGSATYDASSTDKTIVAIQVLDDITFAATTTSDSIDHATPASASALGGSAMSTLSVTSGITLYGRFNKVVITVGKCILYLG
tara:strand:+ start:639 stop:971 length:333 start_codon:yes stop_codon:yes gene_type:complete